MLIDNEDGYIDDPWYRDAYDWIVEGPDIPEENAEPDTESSNNFLREQLCELKRTKGKFCRNGCGNQIYLQQEKNGSWQPYNQNDRMIHRCNTGRDYNKTGIHESEIQSIHNVGWFCDSCKNIVINQGLTKERKTI